MQTNATALSRLLLAERPSLLRLAQRIVGSGTAAEDVTQSLWFRVQQIEDDPPILNKRAYLFRLATNLATDWRRADTRYCAMVEASGELPENVADDIPSAETALLDREKLDAMLAALDELPPRVREIFMARKFENIPVNEIAERYSLTRSAIAKMMQRALLHCDARLNGDRE
jgi:RNA polymerase sigma-70 factor (ECF subfamily)